MLQNNTRSVTFTSGPGFTDGSSGTFQQLPKKDFSHIVIWAQRAAIFKTAEHPAAAKLFMNFLLTKEQQIANGGFSVRDDVPPQKGLKRTSFLPILYNWVFLRQLSPSSVVSFHRRAGPTCLWTIHVEPTSCWAVQATIRTAYRDCAGYQPSRRRFVN